MPTTTVPGFILDGYGRAAVFQSSGVLHRRTIADDRLRPRPPNHFADYIALFTPQRYCELVSECRSAGSRGLVAAILEQKSDYVSASGFRPRFMGSDTAWGRDALPVLEAALKICNLRGSRFDWRASWRLAVPTRATDGRFFILLTRWDTGWPAVQFLEGHRIGQRQPCSGLVGQQDAVTTIVNADGSTSQVRGAYTGLAINNGVITNAWGTEVAYRVLGPTPEQDQDISARDMIQVATPQRYSEGTPVPDLARALLDFMALDAAQTSALDQQIGDAKFSFLETNESGRQDPITALAGMNQTVALDGTPTEVIERATYRYAKSGTGRLQPVQTNRPSDQWMNFDMRVASRAAAAVRWRVEMLDPSALRGAATRAFQDQINTSIKDEFDTLVPAAVRVIGYFVSVLIDLGQIPKSPEWMSWEIAPPPWFEVDRASSRMDIEDVAAGRTPMSVLHGRDGLTTEEVYMLRATAYQKALDVQKKFPEVPIEFIRGDLGMTAQRTGTFSTAPTGDPNADTSNPAQP